MTCPPNWIRLNVGGKVFQTSKQTLCRFPESFLARLAGADQQIPAQKDDAGAILIDRDPDYFQAILNYLRTGRLVLSNSIVEEQLMEEADFYGLPSLCDAYAALMQKEGAKKFVETVFVCKCRGGGSFKVTTTNISDDYCVLKELKSPKRGLEVTGSNGYYEVDNFRRDTDATERTIRDAVLSCGLKLIAQKTDANYMRSMEFNNV